MSIAKPVPHRVHKTSLGTAALIAGIGLLIMAIAAPFAELYAYPQLIVPENAAETVEQARQHVANAMHADPHEIYFTGCATESNKAVLKSLSAQLDKQILVVCPAG